MNYISTILILIVTLYTFYNINVEGFRTRIIGGRSTQPRQIKYLVGIYRNGNYICGGGIIGQKYILTAAHCVVESTTNALKTGKFNVVAGSDNLNIKTPSTMAVDVTKFYVPSVYNGSLWNGNYPTGDVAVLELKSKLNLPRNENLQKLELPTHDVNSEPNDAAYKRFPAEVAGFGKDNFTYYSDKDGKTQMKFQSSRVLMQGRVQIVDRIVCKKSYVSVTMDSIICGRVKNYVDDTPQGICKGDSGSPLVQNGTVVIGVVSASSKSCNDNQYPGVYTKVASFKKFIKNVKQGNPDDMRVQIL